MKITENSKIRILSPEHSEYVQKIAFESGLWWHVTKKNTVMYTDAKFLFFYPSDRDRRITWSDSEECFISEKSKEIFIPIPEPEWNGEGLPPVGTVCEIDALGDGDFEECMIESYSIDGSVVLVSHQRKHGRDYNYWHIDDDLKFRPIETEAQKAARKRDEWAKSAIEAIQNRTHALSTESERLGELYDWLLETNQLKEDE